MTVALATGPGPEPLGALLARLEQRLRSLAFRYVRDSDASCDVVQNAFEKVLRHGSTFRGDASASTWIHRIVVNEALMWLRSERRRRSRWSTSDGEPLADVADEAPLALEEIEREEARRRVRCALARLRPIDRDVLEGTVLAGVTSGGYARGMGLDRGVVKSRAYRARRELARLLSDSR